MPATDDVRTDDVRAAEATPSEAAHSQASVRGDAPHAALFGKDDAPRIVDVQPLLDGSFDDGPAAGMRLYRRSADFRSVETEDVPFYPFFFLSDIALLRGFDRARFQFQELAGENFYRHLVAFRTWADYWEAVRRIERATGSDQRRPEELYLIGSPAQQYLMQEGRTCFKGMRFDEVHRLQLDIETYAEAGFPNPERPEDEIIIVALSDNRGWQKLLYQCPGVSEQHVLEELVQTIREKDPDVIEGHNIHAFDFDYLMKRCALHGVRFAIGRDGSEPRVFPSSIRFAERVVEFPALETAGRHVVDTYFQVMAFDVFKRDLPGYGLKDAAKYFGFAPEGRTYVAGEDIPRMWREDRERLLRYALDDVTETERLARHLSGSAFYLTQMLPMPYGQAARTGPAAKIESLFVREYLRRRQSIPRSQWGSQSVGGYTDVFVTGVVGPVVYADVESLYPSIMPNYGVRPAGDALGLFPDLLRRLTDLRFEAKDAMQATDAAEARSELDARQSSYKVLINSFYGVLGYSLAAFNDFQEADRVARVGQGILRTIIRTIRERGGRVVEADTDGVLFVPPEHVRGAGAERAFTEALTEAMPEGIRVGFDGRFRKMLSYKKKNYALLTYGGAIKFKGSSLVARSNERFGRRFVRRAIRLLLDEDLQGLHDCYLEARRQIEEHDWKDVTSFARTETLKDTPAQYEADVTSGKRTRAAAYELAVARSEETGRPVRKGDRISYYVTGRRAGVTAFENCQLAADWDLAAPDENTAYYLRRLDQFAQKFEPFFAEHDFRRLFSPEDLFGFSAEGITLKVEERTPEVDRYEDEVPF